MRFLVDECTGPKVAEWLRKQNHEVFSVSVLQLDTSEIQSGTAIGCGQYFPEGGR